MLKPEIVVYLWMFPCFLFFVFPVLCMPFIMLVQKMPISLSGAANRETDYLNAGEKRQHSRKKTEGVFAQVFSGDAFCNVSVNNVSKRGICFGCSPEELDHHAENLGMIINESGKNIHLQLKPQWSSQKGNEHSVGASIVNSYEKWEELTKNIGQANTARQKGMAIPLS